jgi:hypothetical protein
MMKKLRLKKVILRDLDDATLKQPVGGTVGSTELPIVVLIVLPLLVPSAVLILVLDKAHV